MKRAPAHGVAPFGRACPWQARCRMKTASCQAAAADAATIERGNNVHERGFDTDDDRGSANTEDLYAEFDKLLQGTITVHNEGDTCMGKVISTDRKMALVDIGGKGCAEIHIDEITTMPIKDASEVLRPGEVRKFTVLGEDDDTDVIQLSMVEEERTMMWRRLKQMQEEDVTLPGHIVSANMGGVLVDVLNMRGFVPISHLGVANNSSEPDVERTDLVGETIEVKFLELDEETEKFMLSARRAESADTLTNFKIGDVVEGIVSRVMEYGAFVDVDPGGTGLLHISQVSHDRIGNLEDLMAVGDRLKVMIMAHDRDRGRLAFSTKKLEPSPGDMLKDPAKVFASAEDMAELFKIRVQAAEQAAREEEARMLAATSDPVDLDETMMGGYY